MAGERQYVGAYPDEVPGEDVGGYDIVGAPEGYDIVGAPPARRQFQQPPRMPGNPSQGVRVMRDQPDIMRRQIAPIELTTIAAGATATIELRPQRPIRIERLLLDGATLGGLFVTDLLIGAETQFVNSGAVPVSVFAPTAFGTDLRGNTASPGITVTVRVLNSTGGALTIGGAIIGSSLT